MKKLLVIILFLLFLLIVKNNVANNYVIGDVNGDGEVTNVDNVLVQRHILELEKLTKSQTKRADTNKDGVIDIVDLANIQKIILGVD